MTEPSRPEEMWAQAWQQLSRGKADRRHPARTPTLATIGPDGPRMRSVILRGLDRAAAVLEVHSDRASDKVAEIAADPRVACHVWCPKADLQIRVSGTARLIHADPARWQQVPAAARAVYGGTPAPGTRLDRPEDHAAEGALERFTAIRITVEAGDILYLGADRHRRVRARRDGDGWVCDWIAP